MAVDRSTTLPGSQSTDRQSSGVARPLAQVLLRKLLLAYVALAVGILAVQLVIEYRGYRQEVLDTLQSQANTIGPGAAVAVWDYQDSLLNSMVKGIGQHPAVVFAEIMDYEAGHGASWRAPGSEAYSTELQVRQPLELTLPNGTKKPVGMLTIASSEERLWRHLRGVLLTIILDDAALLLPLGFILWLLVHSLAVRPLSRFSAQVMKRTEAPGHPVDLGKTDVAEIVTLQQCFNQLMRQIEESHARIARQNAELEQKVAERTHDLERKNSELLDAIARREELTTSLRDAQIIAGLGSYAMDLRSGAIETSDVLDRLFGLDEAHERSIRGWMERVHPDDRGMIHGYFSNEVLGQGRDFDKEYCIVRHDDRAVRWIHGLGKLEFDADGLPIRMRGTAQDITERVQSEERLRNSLHQLEEKELAKTRFLAAAGHDLRQPVAAANLFVDALRFTSPTPHQMELIQRLDQSMCTFSELLEQLLDISKFDAGVVKPKLASFDLAEVFYWLEHNFGQTARDKQLRFTFRFPAGKSLIIRTDIGLLQSVLMNLVSNAIKFTKTGGILIGARPRGGRVLLQVWDTGIGISQADIAHIFDEFFQVANPQRNREAGLGLGLSICQRAVKLLDCEIACRSRLGRGSMFELNLPLNVQEIETERLPVAPSDGAGAPSVTGKRVVVVEDDALVAAGMVNMLREAGADVLHYPNAEEALRGEGDDRADFYVADYSLGGSLTGLQFLESVQQQRGVPIRAVILTGETSSKFISSVEGSPWPVLHKPVNYTKLTSVLSSLRE